MRRRTFLQRLGLGSTGMLISTRISANKLNSAHHFSFSAERIEDLFTTDGLIMLRFNYTSSSNQLLQDHKGKFRVKGGTIHKIKSYLFHEEFDDLDPQVPGMKIQSDPGHEDVLVIWIKDATEDTTVTFPLGKRNEKVSIRTIIKEGDHIVTRDIARVSISYLLDKEIGEIDPSDVGIRENGDNFSFTVMADPQGGNPFAHETVATRMRIHNAFIDESVRVVNELENIPVFNLVLGDIVDGQGHHEDFRAMNDMLAKVKVPTLYELGNHETRYKSIFSPGYNMDAFKNYFAAQKEFNGMDKLLYSFNLGKWHFIVWPDPLRAKFWELHPHYFDWLEQDLEKYKDRPTFFFQHIPMHPIGINPLINYAESVVVKRTLLDILGKHGNVKYILSGHVHIPMKAAVKTAVEYKGMKMINLPAAGYRPRAFGEEDFNGGPSQGVAIIEISGKEAIVKYKSVVNEMFTFPSPSPFIKKDYPLWLNHKWELAHPGRIKNGNFSDGLKHWHKRFTYMEDVHPSNVCESLTNKTVGSYLHLSSKPRGFRTPGQDRMPQALNRICQVITHPEGQIPIISMLHWLDPEIHREYGLAGTYIWIEGFKRGLKRLNVVYSTDHIYWNLGGKQSQLRTVLPVQMEITKPAGKWWDLRLNPVEDFKKVTEMEESYPDLFDTLAITMGVWTINVGFKNTIGAGYSGIKVSYVDAASAKSIDSTIDNETILPKEQKYMWWGSVGHIAGEHQLFTEDLNNYLK